MDRFNSTVRFSFDYFSNRLRVNSSLQKISFDLAYGAEAHSAAMIEALSLRLCDGIFKDEETDRNVIVVSVERNMDDTLRNKSKEHLKFTGVVAWVFNLDGPVPTKWNKAHLEECKVNPTRRYQLCTPMDPADFDVDSRTIPHCMSSMGDVVATPMKKKGRKDPDDLTPEVEWKPSMQSSRSSKIHDEVNAVSAYVKKSLSACVVENFRSLASRWLYRALQAAVQLSSPDYRVTIQMALETAPLDDMDMAFEDVFGISAKDDSTPRSRNKELYLQGYINNVFDHAERV
jgi:hypothetical protein